MTEIALVRQETEPLKEEELEVVRRVLFRIIDGLGPLHRKRWRRFVNGLLRLEPGEVATITTSRPRSGAFHRRHMALEHRIFEAQERFVIFDPGFRDWLKVGAGFVEWYPKPGGGMFAMPKSIAYDKLSEDGMREFHDNVVAFLRTEEAGSVLWPHLGARARDEVIERALSEFGE